MSQNPLIPAFDEFFVTVKHAAIALAQRFRAKVAEMQGDPKPATRAQKRGRPKAPKWRHKFFMPLHLKVSPPKRNALELYWDIHGVKVDRSGRSWKYVDRIKRPDGMAVPDAKLIAALKGLNPESIRTTRSETKAKQRKTFAGLTLAEYRALEELVLDTERQAALLRKAWTHAQGLRNDLRGHRRLYAEVEEVLALAPLADLGQAAHDQTPDPAEGGDPLF